MENLKRSLEIEYLIRTILICNSIIKRAFSPELTSLFLSKRNLASEKLNQIGK